MKDQPGIARAAGGDVARLSEAELERRRNVGRPIYATGGSRGERP